ncbi:MAG: ribosome maturation factor RimM [Gemmatimonadota bacterium]
MAIGRLVKAHGLHGEVAVFPLTGHPERFAAGRQLFLSATPEGRDGVPILIEASRAHAGRYLLKLDRIENRSVAEQAVGQFLVISRVDAERAREEGEFFLHALVGRAVRTADGRLLGEIVDVLEPGGAAVLEIGEAGGGRRLLPFVREFVREVGEETIVVDPPQGWEEL